MCIRDRLTTSTEIRILLCYLIQHAGTPLAQGELETALLGEELVNYFELASNLSDLLEQGLSLIHIYAQSSLPS